VNGIPLAEVADDLRVILDKDADEKLPPVRLWAQAVMDSGLSVRAKHLAHVLSEHMNPDGGSCYPGLDLLASQSSRHRATVVRAITELVEGGWVKRWRRGGRRMEDGGVPNQYAALVPEDLIRPSQEENGLTVAPGERSGAATVADRERSDDGETVASGGPTVAKRGVTVAKRGPDRRRRRTGGGHRGGQRGSHGGGQRRGAVAPTDPEDLEARRRRAREIGEQVARDLEHGDDA